MSFPAGVQTVTVTAGSSGYHAPDGTPYAGTIRFTPSVSRVTSATYGVIALGPVNVTLSASGQFTQTLLATDAAGFSPTGWTYRVDEEFTNAPGRSYNISLPAAAPSVDLPSLAPVAATTGTVSSPAVLSVNGETGVVILDAADVGAAPTTRQISAGTGLTGGGTLAADRTLAVAFGTTGATVCVGNDSRLSDARTPTAHAASHGSGGSDQITIAQSQVTGLTVALSGKVAGPVSATDNAIVRYDGTTGVLVQNSGVTVADDGSMTVGAALTVGGYTTLQGGQFNSDFAAFGSMTLIGTGKRVRFRPTGGDIDVEGGGKDVYLSVWSNEDFTGAQHTYLRLEYNAGIAHAVGTWLFADSPFGGGHTLTGTTLGLYGASPVVRQTVTGSRASGAALADLLTKLAAVGIIADGSTA